jgi:hypothetical protein
VCTILAIPVLLSIAALVRVPLSPVAEAAVSVPTALSA